MLKPVLADNRQHALENHLFSDDYLHFVWRLLHIQPTSSPIENIIVNEKPIETVSDNNKKRKKKLPSKWSLRLHQQQVGLQFLTQLLFRSADQTKLAMWTSQLGNRFKTETDSARWLIKWLLVDERANDDLLFGLPQGRLRASIATIIGNALHCLVQSESVTLESTRLLLESIPVKSPSWETVCKAAAKTKPKSRSSHSDTSDNLSQSNSPSLSAVYVHKLFRSARKAPSALNRQCFVPLLHFARSHPSALTFLMANGLYNRFSKPFIKSGAFSTLVGFNRTYLSVPPHLHTLAQLMLELACTTESSSAERVKGHSSPPNGKPTDWRVIRSNEDESFLYGTDRYVLLNLIKKEIAPKEINRFVVLECWCSDTLSLRWLNLLLNGIKESGYDVRLFSNFRSLRI